MADACEGIRGSRISNFFKNINSACLASAVCSGLAAVVREYSVRPTVGVEEYVIRLLDGLEPSSRCRVIGGRAIRPVQSSLRRPTARYGSALLYATPY
jgi:hypothetical protein